MLRRSRVHRLLATLTSAWFALYVAVAPVALPCPMPHGTATSAAVADDAPDALAHEGAHAGHAMPMPAADDVPESAPIHPCDCTTDCCAVPVGAMPSAPVVAAAPESRPPAVRLPAPPMVRAASRTLLLPFAHGPPS